MHLHGVITKYCLFDEKTGACAFYVKEDTDGTMLCEGTAIRYPIGTPVSMNGYVSDNSFKFKTIIAEALTASEMVRFIKGGKGGGAITAQEIVARVGVDIFNIFSTKTLKDVLPLVPRGQIYLDILRRISSIPEKEQLFRFITKNKGQYRNAISLYTGESYRGIEHIKNNPYVLCYTGLPFRVCDNIGRSNDIPQYNKERTAALIWSVMEKNHRNGNTRIRFEDVIEQAHAMEKNTRQKPTKVIFLAAALANSGLYQMVTEDNELYFYKKSDYQNEISISNNLNRIKRTAVAVNKKIRPISLIEQSNNITLSDEQKETFNLLKTTGVKIITGGPGTGKTTLLKCLLQEYSYANPGKNIVLCAPTGKAAKRMSEATGRKALTLHRLLNFKPYEKPITETLRADLFVVDECSMIDAYVFSLLLQSVKDGATVILLGDEDQLPSVDAGNVLADLLASSKVESYRLKKVFRQKDGFHAIIDNSRNIINGQTELKEETGIFTMNVLSHEKMIEKAINYAVTGYKKGLDIKLFSPVRQDRYDSSTEMINRAIQIKLHQGKNTESVTYGKIKFCEGDKIIFLHNNYEKEYINGQEGTINCIQIHSDNVYLTVLTEDHKVMLKNEEIDDIDLAYAITAHKAQGSECEYAIIIVPAEPKAMLQRKLLYVEVTRAKKGVIILSEGNALIECIADNNELQRNTGLRRRIA